MIKQLQLKLIVSATAAIVIVISVLLLMVNVYNYRTLYAQNSVLLHYIADSNGVLPELNSDALSKNGKDIPEMISESDESRYQLRYFTVWYEKKQDVITVNTYNLEHIGSISEEEAHDLASQVLANETKTEGRITSKNNHYAYLISSSEDGNISMVTFLDYTSNVFSITHYIERTVSFALLCLVLFIIVTFLLSKRALRPFIRNMESQKQFITNAGHELKTPLTIISANAEVLEMLNGESEWTDSIRKQVTRMSGLVDDLVMLSRLSEQLDPIVEDVNMSSLFHESTQSFAAVAENRGKKLECTCAENVMIRASSKGINELMNILLDNAVKYCDDGGTIAASLSHRTASRGARLVVSNTYAAGKNEDYKRFFERFYRADTSHARDGETDGSGIGLSMAQGFVEQYHGKITVDWKNNFIIFTVIFP